MVCYASALGRVFGHLLRVLLVFRMSLMFAARLYFMEKVGLDDDHHQAVAHWGTTASAAAEMWSASGQQLSINYWLISGGARQAGRGSLPTLPNGA